MEAPPSSRGHAHAAARWHANDTGLRSCGLPATAGCLNAEVGVVGEELVHASPQEGADLANQVAGFGGVDA